MYVFPKDNIGLSIKNTRFADFCVDRIEVITNFAIITNAVIKWVHCKLNNTIVEIIKLCPRL